MLASINALRRTVGAPLARDERGITAVTTGLALAMLAGFAGLAIDASAWQTAKRDMQGTADQAAYSAAVAANASADGTLNAKGVTAQMGYVDGQSSVTVTVNNPPLSGGHTTDNKAWEVIITKPQPMWFAGLFMASAPSATARAVAIPGVPGQFCLLALDSIDSGTISIQGTPQVTTPSCNVEANSTSSSAITLGGSATLTANTVATVGSPGIFNNGSGGVTATKLVPSAPALRDPYASVSVPSSSTWGSCSPWPNISGHQTKTVSAGCYTGTLSVGTGQTLVMNPGTYYVDRGSFQTQGSGTITGSGVTIVLTSSTGSNWPTISFSGSSTVNLSAQTSGTFSGLVVYADRRIPTGTGMSLGGGSSQTYTGDLYFPTSAVNFGGNASAQTCSRLIAYEISLTGTSTFESSCAGLGTANLSGTAGLLAE